MFQQNGEHFSDVLTQLTTNAEDIILLYSDHFAPFRRASEKRASDEVFQMHLLLFCGRAQPLLIKLNILLDMLYYIALILRLLAAA